VQTVQDDRELCREWCLCQNPGASDLTQCESQCLFGLFNLCSNVAQSPVYECEIAVGCEDPFQDCREGESERESQCSDELNRYNQQYGACFREQCNPQLSAAQEACRADCGFNETDPDAADPSCLEQCYDEARGPFEQCQIDCGNCGLICALETDGADPEDDANRNCRRRCEADGIRSLPPVGEPTESFGEPNPNSGDAENILAETCGTTGCHDDSSQAQAGLDLVSPGVTQRVVGTSSIAIGCTDQTLVVAGDPENSYLFDKILNEVTICGLQMPIVGALNQEEVDVIRDWIVDLAQ
jgi:hypothetical protein